MVLLSIRNLHKQYGNVTAIQSLDLDLEKAKSSYRWARPAAANPPSCAASIGLEPHQGGSIVMDGVGEFRQRRFLANRPAKVGMVFQSYELFAHMTVIENIP